MRCVRARRARPADTYVMLQHRTCATKLAQETFAVKAGGRGRSRGVVVLRRALTHRPRRHVRTCLERGLSTYQVGGMPPLMTTKDVDILEEAHRKEASCAGWWQEQWKASQVRAGATLSHTVRVAGPAGC